MRLNRVLRQFLDELCCEMLKVCDNAVARSKIVRNDGMTEEAKDGGECRI